MSFVKYLLYFMCLHEIIAIFQINFDLTEMVNNNNLAIQHDCLNIIGLTKTENDPYDITSYCMNEWPSKWSIQKSNMDQHFTFAEFYERNITSQQLYIWSAPMDTIENY
ncbi:unnamed protein product [Rotaria sp. Silwood2]|nr:unnamed protein product [Rotaria sp. Silwood2]CAF3283676.1 unnamed protein product [Rotaria sp. Silwood2]CAF4060008.1 unnamed protein product [Rotaria sp. Silwood2]CAF4106076.1 unnamed protein product [Rotaria sp. Silwood2]